MKKTLLALCLGVAAWLLSLPASACLNEVLKKDEARAMLATAQEEVDRGELDAAREHARKVTAGRLWDNTLDARLVDRSIRILALADVRDPNAGPVALDDAERYVGRIRSERDLDPVLEAEYGEILARLPGRADDAHAILSPLAKRDLVGSPWALAALSRVSKDPKEAADARLACERVGGEPWLCGEKVAAQKKWYGPVGRPSEEAISIGFVAGGATLLFGVGGALALVITKRRRRIAAALAT